MKILVITREFPPYVLGGTSYHLAHLYSKIAEQGHEVSVVSGVATQSETAATELVHEDIRCYPVQFGSMSGHHLKFPLRLRQFLSTFPLNEYDVAFIHTPLPYKISIPSIAKYHDCPREERAYFRSDMGTVTAIADRLIDPTRRWVESRSLSSVDHAIFNSDLCRESWERHYSVPSSTVTIYNGVDGDIFYPREDSQGYGIGDYLLFVGDSERKGLGDVLSYAETTPEDIVIVGDVECDLENVHCPGRLSPNRLAEVYSNATTTIHPAQFEAFGNIILESLACGTPVATTSGCGASEILDETCGCVDTPLPEAVAYCKSLSSENCIRKASQFSWDLVAEKTISLADTV